jgi:hypothetical protein
MGQTALAYVKAWEGQSGFRLDKLDSSAEGSATDTNAIIEFLVKNGVDPKEAAAF